MKEFDVLIIGSGMAGLVCGAILSRRGYQVGILEKNKQLGGCLQIYVRDRVIFDSGVHYIGGLDPGQNLHQIFKWLGILDQLKLEKLDEDGFDRILLEHDPQVYCLSQGYPRFIKQLCAVFPEEEAAIRGYCDQIRYTCSQFPLYSLNRGGSLEEKTAAMTLGAQEFIDSLTENKKLRAVLAGNTILYAGEAGETPFYVHALILNSYIESSWKVVDGGFAIARELAKGIRNQGGLIFNNSEVTRIMVKDGLAEGVLLGDGTEYRAKHIISNMHPARTMAITETPLIRPVYRNRLKSLKNTVSVFILNIVFRNDQFPHSNHNYYYHREGRAWTMADYTAENWPLGYAIYFTAASRSSEFAAGMTVFTYMKFDDVAPWADTINTTRNKQPRGADYEAFKTKKAEKLLDLAEEKFPGLRKAIQSYYTSTPLSFRDYIGTDDGSLYGIARDYHHPVRTMIPAGTKLPNLYLTGQNLNLHGILGSAISALVTCTAFLGQDEFIDEIKHA